MRKVNHKSDFSMLLRLFARQAGRGEPVELPFPDHDWKAVSHTGDWAFKTYTASCIGGECVNCVNDGGRIRVVFNDHRLSPGCCGWSSRRICPTGGTPTATSAW